MTQYLTQILICIYIDFLYKPSYNKECRNGKFSTPETPEVQARQDLLLCNYAMKGGIDMIEIVCTLQLVVSILTLYCTARNSYRGPTSSVPPDRNPDQ